MSDKLIELDRIARLSAAHALVYTRYLMAPLEDVWPLISTADGLTRWWIAPVSTLELTPGGRFEHHWTNTVAQVDPFHFIDFNETGAYNGTGGLRFEVSLLGAQETRFTLLATVAPDTVAVENAQQPFGVGTVWAGLAAGWHGAACSLEQIFDPTHVVPNIVDLTAFYEDYLSDHLRYIQMVEPAEPTGLATPSSP